MAIKKYDYELSVWKEGLAAEGQRKDEKKMAIIGANDMDYAGRATQIKFKKKLNGTHDLTFKMPDKYFDSLTGDFIHNELIDALFNECKIKLFYKNKWYEFYIKKISDSKQFKSIIRTYECTDTFIDELSRTGYGITFDEELYNNVDEIGVFSEEILDDSVWEYDASLNWGDFTEYTEEKLFKVPLSIFGGTLTAHKLDYSTGLDKSIMNIFTHDTRPSEMGDDLSRQNGIFWNQYPNNTNSIFSNTTELSSENSAYIYVPYSQLDFCYVSSNIPNGLDEAFVATEEPANYGDKGYAIAPTSVDPSKLIQFIYIPSGAKIEIDERGLIVNKDYTYIITIDEWNKQIDSEYFYAFEDYKENGYKVKKLIKKVDVSNLDYIYGNWAAYYDGYLDTIGDLDVEVGKKIAISNRTEINISDEIDQYVEVYNNKATEYTGLYSNENWEFHPSTDENYRVCSKNDTRQIVPQLARNLVQNGKDISLTTGWEIMKTELTMGQTNSNAQLEFGYTELENKITVGEGPATYEIDVGGVKESYLIYLPSTSTALTERNGVVNFGIVGQEKQIEKGKTYALGINIRLLSQDTKVKYKVEQVGDLSNVFIRIGNGQLVSDGDYSFKTDEYFDIKLSDIFVPTTSGGYNSYTLIRPKKSYSNPYIAIYSDGSYELLELTLFEAYTKGADQFPDATLRYSGRDLFSTYTTISKDGFYCSNHAYRPNELRNLILFEDDVMPGDTYSYKHYFIQQLRTDSAAYDTFMAKKYLSEDGYEDKLPLNSGLYTEDDYKIYTNYIDLNNCEFYNPAATISTYDCKCGSQDFDKVCLYQKYGYCPYRFQHEQHCRKVRTLKGEKSNRFNLTQELGKVFQIYPMYWTSHDINNGNILTQQQAVDAGLRTAITPGRADWMDKRLFYITEKGSENKLGFRYEKNLKNISRNLVSDKLITKLYVLDQDSDISKTGLCSIKTAEDNPSKDNFIIDFTYYITQGLLNKDTTMADLYGTSEEDLGFLKTLGYYNTQYDILSNKMINLSAASYTELKANLEVNLTGIEAAQKKLREYEKILSKYTAKIDSTSYATNSTYLSYRYEYIEQNAILVQLIEDTFYTDGISELGTKEQCPPAHFLDDLSIEQIKKQWVDTHAYTYGILGQFNKEYHQLEEWKKEQAQYLRKINKLSLEFYRKYEPYIKEGTWSDGNYISDNAYYHSACINAKESAIPSVSYSITTDDIEPIDRQGDYIYDIADTTYVEDISLFGVDKKSGLPNRLKVLVSSITEDPDMPNSNQIEVQNFTTQFDDLFQQITASVQSLTFNENIYKRSSNFTSQQNIEKDSLQGTLNQNNLDLVNTEEQNIKINWEGQSGSDINNHANKYKLNGQGLFFSNNGGQSWNTAITPDGINTDYLKAGTIDASKIRIVDGNYIYFSWDRSGIRAYKDPALVEGARAFKDFAQFNKYGLSLVENNKIKLRAGYNYIPSDMQNHPGDIDYEQDIESQTPIGFYLYNSAGQPIFSTQASSSEATAATETARLNLVGEILASNDASITSFLGYLYGGTCYTKTAKQFYNLGDNSNLINSAAAQISGGIATYHRSASSPATPSECAAFIAFTHIEDGLTEIQIIEEDETITSFTNPLIISGSSKIGYITVSTEIRFVNFIDYTATFSNQPNQLFAIIAGSQTVFKGLAALGNTTTINTFVASTDSEISQQLLPKTSEIEGVNLDTEYESSGIHYTYYKRQSINNLYRINSHYYTQYLNEQTHSGNGQVALYINNRTDLNESTQVSNSSRLLCCCQSEKTEGNTAPIKNIFTILKDGSLHMGGVITNSTGFNAVSLPDQISISGEYFVIGTDGKLHMSFDDIVNIDTDESITSYISNQLANTTSSIMSEVNSEISSILNRQHDHYINEDIVSWERPDTIEIDDVEYNIENLTIDLHDGYTVKTISLKDFLDKIGYNNDLTYGDTYTSNSSI